MGFVEAVHQISPAEETTAGKARARESPEIHLSDRIFIGAKGAANLPV